MKVIVRVSHVITRLIVGGAQENTVASVLGLRERHAIDADLLSGPTSGPEGSIENWVAQHPGVLTVIPELVRPIHPLNDWRALKLLARHFSETRPDIVHTHSGKAGVLGRLAARRAGVPRIVHTIHGPSFGRFQGPLANALFRSAERRAGRVTDHFVVVAHAMRDQYLAAGIGTPEQYTRIFSGFPLDPFLKAENRQRLRKSLGFSKDDFIVGKIARLFELKGHEDLFAVASAVVRQNPRIKFLLVGDGIWRKRFETILLEYGLEDRFRFTGLIPPEEIPSHVGIMDALVHLSFREGLPRALPQAMAAAKPVIAYDCDGAGEVCLPGETGLLVRPGDLRALENALLTLAADPALCRRLGSNGRALVRERFPVEHMIDDLHQLYLRLLDK